jgi:hypothetical protein
MADRNYDLNNPVVNSLSLLNSGFETIIEPNTSLTSNSTMILPANIGSVGQILGIASTVGSTAQLRWQTGTTGVSPIFMTGYMDTPDYSLLVTGGRIAFDTVGETDGSGNIALTISGPSIGYILLQPALTYNIIMNMGYYGSSAGNFNSIWQIYDADSNTVLANSNFVYFGYNGTQSPNYCMQSTAIFTPTVATNIIFKCVSNVGNLPNDLYAADSANFNISVLSNSIGEQGPVGPVGQTLPVIDSTSIVYDSVDNTKLMKISTANQTTATTRVLSMADRNYDLNNPVVNSLSLLNSGFETTIQPYSGLTANNTLILPQTNGTVNQVLSIASAGTISQLQWSTVSGSGSAYNNGTQVFTSSGNFTVPTGITSFNAWVVGAGAGSNFIDGYGSLSTVVSQAGGSGSIVYFVVKSTTPGTVFNIVVGNGGIGGSFPTTPSQNGEDSTITLSSTVICLSSGGKTSGVISTGSSINASYNGFIINGNASMAPITITGSYPISTYGSVGFMGQQCQGVFVPSGSESNGISPPNNSGCAASPIVANTNGGSPINGLQGSNGIVIINW